MLYIENTDSLEAPEEQVKCPECDSPLQKDSQMEEMFGYWFSQNYYYCEGCGYTATES